MIKLKYIGIDGWDRAVYEDIETKRLYCDTELKEPNSPEAYIHTKYNGFDGEPDYPIKKDSYIFIQ